VPFGDRPNDDFLNAPVRPADFQFVAVPDQSVRLGRLSVDGELSEFAGFLRFRPRLEQARHVKPDIQPDFAQLAHLPLTVTAESSTA
jgi:hypothetical protein